MAVTQAHPVTLPNVDTPIVYLRVGALDVPLPQKSGVAIFGHADADGHLATEQTRTNLAAAGFKVKEVVVGPSTAGYRFWERTFPLLTFNQLRVVVCVDIAFNFRNPVRSLDAVLRTADNHPTTHFLVIDHHPLMKPASPRPNLTFVEVDSARSCCVGPPSSELMDIAAICDGSDRAVISQVSSRLKKRALGVSRAARDVGGVAGAKLLALLRSRNWYFFEELAEEPREFHMAVRGRRSTRSLKSPLLEAANVGAVSLHSTLPQVRRM